MAHTKQTVRKSTGGRAVVVVGNGSGNPPASVKWRKNYISGLYMALTGKKMARSTGTSKSNLQLKHSRDKQPRKKLPTKAAWKGVPAKGSIKRVSRWHPGMVALWDINHYQKWVDLLIQNLPF